MQVENNKILVVEDYPEMSDILRIVLENAGFSVTCAKTGEEALVALRQGKSPSLIVLDNMLPDMTALGFLEKKKNEAVGQNVPVMICSATNFTGNSLLPREVVGVLRKPFQISELLGAISKFKSANPKVSSGPAH